MNKNTHLLGAVSAGHQLTVEAAAKCLRDGGNAVDAAIAAAWMACVCEPVLTSPGGGGFAAVRTSDGNVKYFDFFAQSPKKKRTKNIDFRDSMKMEQNTWKKKNTGRPTQDVPHTLSLCGVLSHIAMALPAHSISAHHSIAFSLAKRTPPAAVRKRRHKTCSTKRQTTIRCRPVWILTHVTTSIHMRGTLYTCATRLLFLYLPIIAYF